MGLEDLGGKLGEGLSAIFFFGLSVDMNAIFSKDGCGATSTDHDVGNGSVVDALGVDDLEVSTSGRGRGDDDPIGVSGIERAIDAGS